LNRRILYAKQLRTLFFTRDRIKSLKNENNLNSSSKSFSAQDHLSELNTIKFKCWDKFGGLIEFNPFLCCRKRKLSQGQMIYEEGLKKLENELNVLTILQTLQKVKASLSFLIHDEDSQTLNEIKNVYLSNASLFTNRREKAEHKSSKN